MAYYFMIENERGKYRPLDISKSRYYSNYSKKFNKAYAYTLQEIDQFTTGFENEKELRECLVKDGLLPYVNDTKPLSIRILKNGIYNRVPYDFLYLRDLEYIMEPERLIKLIMDRYYQNDLIFLKKIASHFVKRERNDSTAIVVLRLIEASIYEGRLRPELEERDNNADTMVERMLKLIIYNHYIYPNGNVEYNIKVNHRNLHELIAFVRNYDEKSMVSSESIELLDNKDNKVKKRVRNSKNYILDGQLKFDI